MEKVCEPERMAVYLLWMNISGFYFTVEGINFKIMVKHDFKKIKSSLNLFTS
jgi:hypothetical protein